MGVRSVPLPPRAYQLNLSVTCCTAFACLFQQEHLCHIWRIATLHHIWVECADRGNHDGELGQGYQIVAVLSKGKAPLTSGPFYSHNPNPTQISQILSCRDQQQHCSAFLTTRRGGPSLPVSVILSQSH
jgi:hypothetical protein